MQASETFLGPISQEKDDIRSNDPSSPAKMKPNSRSTSTEGQSCLDGANITKSGGKCYAVREQATVHSVYM